MQSAIAVSTVLPLSAVLPFLFGYLWSMNFTALSHNLAFPQSAETKLPSYAVSERELNSITVEPLGDVTTRVPEEPVKKQNHPFKLC